MIRWNDPTLCFAAGALLPTLAYILLAKGKQVPIPNDDDDNEEDADDSEDEDEDLQGLVPNADASKWGMSNAPYKMVLCVNTSLSMGKGKIAAQCSHAAVACYKRASKSIPNAVRAWEYTGCAKIAVKCPTEDEMHLIAAKAMSMGIPVYLVEDAGRTQIAAGSQTVLGLGPAPVAVFEGVSNHLKLM
eukprot:CAMPEP_0198145414 /NCGR_PEP_ID=MMETSP1443-20131203/23313_1 /TAXON_ID=186043 /ORGANISM="Entomoneis sp., Strain CCMP2396" /LENGTH=187 /DNA_ID=CAMNT_0043809057 /DNA_START=36 /DNA_END=599 /DNA_ORIENTATION=+